MTTRTRRRTPRVAHSGCPGPPAPDLWRSPCRRGAWTAGVLVVAGLMASGCASSGGAFDEGELSNVQVTVENNNWSDITVYVLLAGGTRNRLGFLTTRRIQEADDGSTVQIVSGGRGDGEGPRPHRRGGTR